ncbi:MAG: phosphatase PAP2 family protein [Clostridia bacterium]|nr:phosphatase PAP2 family protein [Clostridia bacterium]MBR3552609.1 phosphatase PAP2 family protein [Clostridia bacterium]
MNELFSHFLNFDLSVFAWVQSIRTPALSALLVAITRLGKWGAVFVALGVCLLLTRRFRKLGAAILVAILVTELGNNFVLKAAFDRPRPFALTMDWWTEVYRYPDLVPRPHSSSFPSGHAACAFAAAFTCLRYDRRIGAGVTVFACVMAFSRVYVGVHYCTDVLFGALAGLLYAAIAVLLTDLCFPRKNGE